MKEYQVLIGKIIIAIAIIIAGILIADAIKAGFANIKIDTGYLAELIRDGLMKFGSYSE
jgi:hypothetical protein